VKREALWISVIYGVALVIVGLLIFRGAYQTLKPFVIEGSGHKVGWVMAAQIGTVSAFSLIIIFARLVNIARSKGLTFVAPRGAARQLLRVVSLSILAMCVIYKILAYGVAFGIPYGAYALMFDHLIPITFAVVMFEGSRVFALEQTVLSPNPTLRPTPESRRG